LIFLLAATIDFGRAVHSAQVLQQAADAGARALARVPLPATMTFEQALNEPTGTVKTQVYNDDLLRVQLQPGESVFDHFQNGPVLNQLLAPLMIVDQNNVASYPGIMKDPNDRRQFPRWRVPVTLEDAGGTIQFVDVVEEIGSDPDTQLSGPFSLTAPGTTQGYVALRVNYPFQAAGLVAYQPQNTTGGQNVPIVVPPQDANGPAGPYGGSDGRGLFYAHGTTVRPFRRLISGQAIYKREVFSN
jgi:hypothetical protein